MTARRGFPPGRSLPEVDLPPGALPTILHRARRRRRQRAVRFALLVVLPFGGIVTSALVETMLHSSAVLVPIQPGPGRAGTSPPDTGMVPGRQPSPPPDRAAEPAPAGSPHAVATGTPTARGSVRPSRPSRSSTPMVLPVRRDSRKSADLCVAANAERSGDWCVDLMVDAHPPDAADAYRFGLEVCWLNPTTTATLNWRTTQEVELEVYDSAGDLVYRWSEGHVIRHEPHSVTVQPYGNVDSAPWCVFWRLDWPPVDRHGAPLDSGLYTMRGWTTADELASVVVDATFTVD